MKFWPKRTYGSSLSGLGGGSSDCKYCSCLVGCTIASKINGTPKGVYLPISKIRLILAVANLLAHNNISQICYCGQISIQSAAVNAVF